MDKLLHDSLTVHLENFGYENIPKLENYNETISSMLGTQRIIDEMYENWRKDHWKGFEEPVSTKEKEENKMITAEEARKESIRYSTSFNEHIKAIEDKINIACAEGEFSCIYGFFFTSTRCKRIMMYKVIKYLEDNGFDVTENEFYTSYGGRSKIFDRQLEISWKEKEEK